MANITISVPDAVLPRVADAFANYYGWTPTILDANEQTVNNPETKQQFTKRMIAQYMRGVVEQWESQQAADSARTGAITDVREKITIT